MIRAITIIFVLATTPLVAGEIEERIEAVRKLEKDRILQDYRIAREARRAAALALMRKRNAKRIHVYRTPYMRVYVPWLR